MHIHTYTCTYILIHYILTIQVFIELCLLHMWDYFAYYEQWNSVVEYVSTCGTLVVQTGEDWIIFFKYMLVNESF